MKRYGFWLFALAVGGLVAWGLLRNPGETATAVFASNAQKKTFVREVSGEGSVRGEVLRLAFSGSGRVAEVYVQEGDRVRQGATLARLENRDLVAERQQVRRQLEAARADLQRAVAEQRRQLDDLEARLREARTKLELTRELVALGAASRQELEQSEQAVRAIELQRNSTQAAFAAQKASAVARVQELQDRLSTLERRLAETHLRAPSDGLILEIPFHAGETPGGPVRFLVAGTLAPEASFSESEGAELKAGQPARIELEVRPDEPLESRVARVLPPVESGGSVSVPVRFQALDLNQARPGYSLTAHVVVNRIENAVVVPLDALVEEGEKTYVWVVEDDRATKHEVRVLDRNLLEAAVEGVEPGAEVVRLPPEDLQEGTTLAVMLKEPSE